MTQFHLARFGNKSGAHDLLGHSGVEGSVLTAIVWRTDAPALSEGLGLEPFVSAYRLNDNFIVGSTVVDLEADRAGMVVTTAAVVPIAAAEMLDVDTLWSTINGSVSVESPLDAARFVLGAAEPCLHTHPAGAKAAASALIAKGQVVWAGKGFRDAVTCLWAHLRPEDRTRLVVGAAAHPDRISVPNERESLRFIKTAASVLPRWAGWPTASSDSAEVADPVRDAMFGDDGGIADGLAIQLGLGRVQFASWRHLAAAATLLDRLPTLDHEAARALLQLLGLLQPDPEKGVGLKDAGMEHLSSLTALASFVDVRGLRGLPWHAYRSGVRRRLFDIWATATVPDRSRTAEVIAAATSLQSEPSDAFLAELGSATSAAIEDVHLERLVAATLTMTDGPDALTWFVNARTPHAIDYAILSSFSAGTPVPEWLRTSAQELRLPIGHAFSVPATDPVAAWREQLALLPRDESADDILAARTGEAGVVTAAVALGDSKLLERAARLAVADPSLLGDGDVNDVSFRTLWFAVARAGGDPWASVRPADAVVPLLDLILAGEHVEPRALESLSRTTSASIATYSRRSSVWSKLPSTAVVGFKEATAQTIARSFRPGGEVIEQPLVAAILSSDLLASVSRESATQALILLSCIREATAYNAIIVIENATFTTSEQATLGNLVRTRGWRLAAERIVALSGVRADLTRAAATVDSMFGFFDRLAKYVKSGSPVLPKVTRSEILDALTTVAAQLYKQGPLTDAVWDRAGGDDADLVSGKTGRLIWGRALQDVLAGRKGAPSLSDLLATMLKDYPSNQQLLALSKTIENGPKDDR
ncbi:hypothetical protein CTKZ_17290 [Cellulomonas algicola]|uniref:Uncharacterized protein n=1 Tax=Cellulomonas algicola TaxID=2071633 RepID=A0A401UZP8_9CELL|nr:hypothetical protein [Cellulomonas algicola]GCD20167.1 hypothetical protein CTKZ_17290 [Cellulomonas algicola]